MKSSHTATKTTTNGATTTGIQLQDLPEEMTEIILSFVPILDLIKNVRLASKTLHRLLDTHSTSQNLLWQQALTQSWSSDPSLHSNLPSNSLPTLAFTAQFNQSYFFLAKILLLKKSHKNNEGWMIDYVRTTESDKEHKDIIQGQHNATKALHGHGKITTFRGSSYCGEFENGRFHGVGEYHWSEGGTYKGQWKYGKQEGQGKIIWKNGNEYTGQFLDNKPQGEGTLTWPNGAWYKGGFKSNMFDGNGVYHSSTGEVYEGGWKDTMRHGYGVCKWTDTNRKYEGWFEKDLFNGKGKFYWGDGTHYEGDYKNNVAHGRGVSWYAVGDVYEGEIRDNKKEGNGVYKWKNGDEYNGGWKGGKKDGMGKYTWSDGSWYEGMFREGESEKEECERKYGDGSVKVGKWVFQKATPVETE